MTVRDIFTIIDIYNEKMNASTAALELASRRKAHVTGLALALEKRAGQIAPQGWEFYAVTGALFVTLAFPGFVYRYLMRRRDRSAAED